MAHLKERLYKCNLCAEMFGSKRVFEEHMKTHKLSQVCRSTSSQQQNFASALVPPLIPISSSSINPPPGFQVTTPTYKPGEITNEMVSWNGSLRAENSIGTTGIAINRLGIHCHQRPADIPSSSGLMSFGRATSVGQINVKSSKGLLLPSDQENKQHQEQQSDLITNKNRKAHHNELGSTHFWSMPPPLIPITASCSTPMSHKSLIHSHQYRSEYLQQPLFMDSSPQIFNEARQNSEVYEQRRSPPRKNFRSLKVDQEESKCGNNSNHEFYSSHTSSACPILPLLLAKGTTSEKALGHALRSIPSVIHFAHRPTAGISTDNS